MSAVTLQQRCLTNFLIRCSYWYYVKSDPIISDYEFDMEFKRLQRMEEDTGNPMIDSPTQMVWGDSESQYPDSVKEKHFNDVKEETDVRDKR